MRTYSEKLKDQRWHNTRAVIIERAGEHCERCGFFTDLFEVHHVEYRGDHPSDTPDELLIALCPECHEELHWCYKLKEYNKKKNELIAKGAGGKELEKLIDIFGV